MSGNPFRQRVQLPDSEVIAPLATPPLSNIQTDRKVKRVRIRTPPPLSPDSVHETTPLHSPQNQTYEDAYFPLTPTIDRTSKPPPVVPTEPNPYSYQSQSLGQDIQGWKDGSAAGMEPSIGGMGVGNPFPKTLETMENSQIRQSKPTILPPSAMKSRSTPTDNKTSKQAMDVDSFKRLLMTGNATPSSSVSSTDASLSTAASIALTPGAEDLAETSSRSRPSFDLSPADSTISSPRSSYDALSAFEIGNTIPTLGSADTKKKAPPPPLPKHRHGKLVGQRTPQTVSFADFTPTDAATIAPRRSSKELPPVPLERTSSDRSAPVSMQPPPPRRPSHSSIMEESDSGAEGPSESDLVSNTRSVAVIVGPPSPTTSFQPRPPRPPRPRGDSNLSISSLRDFTPPSIPDPTNPSKSRPPPPPTRRPGSKPISQTQPPSNNSFPTSDLAPQPNENTSLPETTHRPSLGLGTSSRSSSFSIPTNTLMPPPPPPRRRRGSSKSSVELGAPPAASFTPSGFEGGAALAERQGRGSRDVLGDLDALQKEVEALRVGMRGAG